MASRESCLTGRGTETAAGPERGELGQKCRGEERLKLDWGEVKLV